MYTIYKHGRRKKSVSAMLGKQSKAKDNRFLDRQQAFRLLEERNNRRIWNGKSDVFQGMERIGRVWDSATNEKVWKS
jgi:hypothetical protein